MCESDYVGTRASCRVKGQMASALRASHLDRGGQITASCLQEDGSLVLRQAGDGAELRARGAHTAIFRAPCDSATIADRGASRRPGATRTPLTTSTVVQGQVGVF